MKKEELQGLTDLINKEIENLPLKGTPKELYEPIRYIMQLGGKRLRPLLALLAYTLYKDDPGSIIKPAVAVELFHNFTLMHDDIMDQAPLRRGKATVHRKWNDNIAILSGDVMLVKVYDLLLQIPAGKLKDVIISFNKCAAEVCEGQQFDMNFELRKLVSEEEYLEMITLKTAVLLGFSLEMGAILGDADSESRQHLYNFGKYIGLGFQLKDDLLDVYADKAKFGKQVGGDIIANKKTFLLIKAMENASKEQRIELEKWLIKDVFDEQEKVLAVKTLYDNLKIKELTEKKIEEYFELALQNLAFVNTQPEKKTILTNFVNHLNNREK